MRLIFFLSIFLALFASFDGGPARAQDAGAQTPSLLAPAPVRDPAEDMRQFIQTISNFARRAKPGFAVVVEGTLPLLVAKDENDETHLIPIRTFIRSIDGVLEDGFFHRQGLPRTEEQQAEFDRLAKLAGDSRLKMFAVEYADPTEASAAIAQSRKAGFIPMIAPDPGLTRLPTTPARPLSENGNSILSLADVKNFAIIRDSWSYGSETEFALKMHDNNYDMIVVDVYHGRKPLSRQAVEKMKYKKLGARRLVLATVDIGRAEPFRFYWKPDWREGNPTFIKEPVKGHVDLHYVEYWDPVWQKIITDTPTSYVYGLVAQGFDGVIIRGADSYRFFDGSLEDEEATQ